MIETTLAPPCVAAPARLAVAAGEKPARLSTPPPLDDPWWKWAVDRGGALVLLVLSAPFVLISMLLVKLTSPGPAMYAQTRLGRNGLPFTIYKIRSMTNNCELPVLLLVDAAG